MPFKATLRRVKPVRQGHTPTPVLAPPAPRVRRVLRLATVPTRPRSRVLRAPIKSQPPVTPVTGWSEMRVVHVQLIHMPFKATMRRVKPVRQGHTPTPVLAPPAPRVRRVLRLATVPTRPRSPAPMAAIKSQPPVTPVTGWSEMRVVHVQLIHMPFKATMRRVKPVRQGHTPTPVLAPPAPPVRTCATSGNGANAATVTCTDGSNQVATTCDAGYGLVGNACGAKCSLADQLGGLHYDATSRDCCTLPESGPVLARKRS